MGVNIWTLYLAAAVVLLLIVLLALRVRGRGRHRQGTTPEPESPPPRSRDEITQPLPVLAQSVNPHTGSVGLRAAARTDPGRMRSSNEDDTLLAELEDDQGAVRIGVYAVADGMGGHEKGEVASRRAIKAVLDGLQNHPFFKEGVHLTGQISDEAVLDVLRTAVAAANRAVYREKVEQNSDMGTTIVLVLATPSTAYVANVGDSRAYLIREGQIRQITEDHSLVERMVASGQITEAEARLHPQRNVITRSLGADPTVEADLFVERLRPGDRVMLCSDGLSGMLPDPTMLHIASSEPDLDRACRLLVRAANDAGGKDNISVVLAELLPSPAEQAPTSLAE